MTRDEAWAELEQACELSEWLRQKILVIEAVAVAAERERCAKVADAAEAAVNSLIPETPEQDDREALEYAAALLFDVAGEIREGKK